MHCSESKDILSCMLQYDETESRRERAKNSLERYMHYYERWASNQTVCSYNLSLISIGFRQKYIYFVIML
jgi:hypothetical protein